MERRAEVAKVWENADTESFLFIGTLYLVWDDGKNLEVGSDES